MARPPGARQARTVLLPAAAMFFIALEQTASFLSPDPDDWDCNSTADYLTNALDAVSFFAIAGAFAGLSLYGSGRWGPVGRVAVWTGFGGAVAAGINNPLEHCAHAEILGTVLWIPATIALGLGSLATAWFAARQSILPTYAALALAAGVVLTFMFADEGGLLGLAAAWAVIAGVAWASPGRDFSNGGG